MQFSAEGNRWLLSVAKHGSFVLFFVFLSVMVLVTVPHLLFTLNATEVTCLLLPPKLEADLFGKGLSMSVGRRELMAGYSAKKLELGIAL